MITLTTSKDPSEWFSASLTIYLEYAYSGFIFTCMQSSLCAVKHEHHLDDVGDLLGCLIPKRELPFLLHKAANIALRIAGGYVEIV